MVAIEAWVGAERRGTPRQAVVNTGKLMFGNSVIDCMVLNISPRGARVRFGMPLPVPEELDLQLYSGTRRAACTRWASGVELGLSFQGGPRLTDGLAFAVARAFDLVRATTLDEALGLLKARRYLEEPGLQDAAERAELAIRELEGLLAALLRKQRA